MLAAVPSGRIYYVRKSVRSLRLRTNLGLESINVFGCKDDKYPMLEAAGAEAGTVHYGQEKKIFDMVLELLAACGMILGARLLTSLAVGRCHRPLSSSVHYSLVIFVNCLNLSGGSCV